MNEIIQQFVLYAMCGILGAIIIIGNGIIIKSIRDSYNSKKITLQKIQDELDEIKKIIHQ